MCPIILDAWNTATRDFKYCCPNQDDVADAKLCRFIELERDVLPDAPGLHEVPSRKLLL
eukprot:CAMPEP_0175889596 /NCGR_PEP_ID=MMETSP0107_2-20121207/47358_1 /TAXON_ID=195067 ORGANISM="Goniomonas pacifica, Strain CCMP1869" /NCGR_SAMPLE_ID=MMETSP0107_2 /ASSEMBLY_ACC=CAM_ASM_000203 /LENGTH=58 /DNA_ID=CAMNT_0017210263 /DNA_START=230 /DNA_END=406 /DNA_ORIENTATION=+